MLKADKGSKAKAPGQESKVHVSKRFFISTMYNYIVLGYGLHYQVKARNKNKPKNKSHWEMQIIMLHVPNK